VLFTYRYLFTNHQGLEVNYGFTRLDQSFSSITNSFTSNVHEANASYVLRLPATHRLSPFVTAGLGAFVFSPVTAFSVNGANSSTYTSPDFVYSAGADLALSHRVSLRIGYRGHVIEAPDYNVPALYTNAVTHIAEPFAGLSFHF
jgi:opacity protein-like surface antigen